MAERRHNASDIWEATGAARKSTALAFFTELCYTVCKKS
jgi:hypothetical protein